MYRDVPADYRLKADKMFAILIPLVMLNYQKEHFQ